MSFAVLVMYRCDGCGKTIGGQDTRAVQGFARAMMQLKASARRYRWLTANRGRYRTEKHYCAACADRSVPPNAVRSATEAES